MSNISETCLFCTSKTEILNTADFENYSTHKCRVCGTYEVKHWPLFRHEDLEGNGHLISSYVRYQNDLGKSPVKLTWDIIQEVLKSFPRPTTVVEKIDKIVLYT